MSGMRYYLSLNAQGISETGIFYIETGNIKGEEIFGLTKKRSKQKLKKIRAIGEGGWMPLLPPPVRFF